MRQRSRSSASFALIALLVCAAPSAVRAQNVGQLLTEARAQLDSMNTDAAAVLLRRVLDPLSGAGAPERVRGFVLLGIVQLVIDQPDSARLAFREALRLEPGLRVDSLSGLHPYLLTTFVAEKNALALAQRTQVEARPDTARGAAVVPPARQPQSGPGATAAAHREGSIELSVGAGVLFIDHWSSILSSLNAVGSRRGLMFGSLWRVGYNFTEKLGVSLGFGIGIGGSAAVGSPFAALTYTPGLNRKMSPFFTAGLGMTQVGGHDAYGPHAGVGVRSMIGEKLALRVESRIDLPRFTDLLNSHGVREEFVAGTFSATLGLSYFMGGAPRRASRR